MEDINKSPIDTTNINRASIAGATNKKHNYIVAQVRQKGQVKIMNYDWLKYEVIEKAQYPNLLAEIKESGYSICTVSEFMGLGRCEENNQEIWDKLTGKTEIYASEAFELAKFFGVKMKYLFSHELSIMSEKSVAYWRWNDRNKQKEEEIERSKAIMEIYNELIKKPHLLDFMKVCMHLTEQQREQVLLLLKEKVAIN